MDGLMSNLTPKQARFVEEYLVDLNSTQAAIRAGYSSRSAEVEGSRLLRNAKVAKAVTQAQQARSERTKMEADDVLRELATIGASNAWNYSIGEDGNLRLADGVPESAKRAVASIKRKTRIIPQKNGAPIIQHETEFRLWDKNTALANVGKHLGMFTDRSEVRFPDGVQVEVIRRIVDAEDKPTD
jgi:phage terminase small subunit